MARILNLPSKLQEIGRIRAGQKTGKPKTPMEALDDWRFTSPNEAAIRAIADLYGGTPQPWADRPAEWEIFTTSKLLRVEVPSDAMFSAYEKWGQGGCQRRCDGETCVIPVEDPEGGHLEEVGCWCEENKREPGEHKDACVVTVRLKIVLPDVPGLGIWMLTTGSVYAAMEMPATYDVIDALRMRSGMLIPCTLELDYREEKRSYERFTRKYHVPVLQTEDSIDQLKARILGSNTVESVAPIRPAREVASLGGPAAPADGRSLHESRPGPPPGPRQPLPPAAGSYTPSHLRDMCLENNLDDTGSPQEMIQRLQSAGVEL